MIINGVFIFDRFANLTVISDLLTQRLLPHHPRLKMFIARHNGVAVWTPDLAYDVQNHIFPATI